MKLRPLMILPPVLFFGFAMLAFVGMNRGDPGALSSALEGRMAPTLEAAQPFAGAPPLDDAVLTDGTVKLVNYWASWCAPCRAEHPTLERLAGEGLAIYGINYKDDPARAQGFLDELGNPYAALGADPNGRMAIDWGVYGMPETFVIAGDGTVVLRFAGPVTSRVLEDRIRPALAEAAAR